MREVEGAGQNPAASPAVKALSQQVEHGELCILGPSNSGLAVISLMSLRPLAPRECLLPLLQQGAQKLDLDKGDRLVQWATARASTPSYLQFREPKCTNCMVKAYPE